MHQAFRYPIQRSYSARFPTGANVDTRFDDIALKMALRGKDIVQAERKRSEPAAGVPYPGDG